MKRRFRIWTASVSWMDPLPSTSARRPPGRSVLAIHLAQDCGGQHVDTGLVDVDEGPE